MCVFNKIILGIKVLIFRMVFGLGYTKRFIGILFSEPHTCPLASGEHSTHRMTHRNNKNMEVTKKYLDELHRIWPLKHINI